MRPSKDALSNAINVRVAIFVASHLCLNLKLLSWGGCIVRNLVPFIHEVNEE